MDDALERIYIPGDVRDVLRLVCEAPSTIVMILDCKKSQLSLTISFLNRRKPVNLKDVHLLLKVDTTVTDTKDFVSKNPRRRQGRNSKSRKQDEFRERIGAQQMAEVDRRRDETFGFLTKDVDQSLSNVVNAVQLTLQRLALPLSVATRGVGAATAVAYDRATITWNIEAIRQILSVHQMYRVHRWLVAYKPVIPRSVNTN